jgi:hypothetical protein
LSKKKLSGLTDNYWITDFNYLDEVRRQFHLPDRVEASPEPSEEHLRILREEIDPAAIVLGK